MSSTRIRSTRQYKGMVALGIDPDVAFATLSGTPLPVVDDREAKLRALGLDDEQIAKALAVETKAPVTPAEPEVSVEQSLVDAAGFEFTRGRTYANGAVIEAQARVLKTGSPEVVATSGNGRIKAVLITRTESGDVSVQNLALPKD